MSDKIEYEYAIIRYGDDPAIDGIHRGPWPKEECFAWVGKHKLLFQVVRRPISAWKVTKK
jgi:hypothetical protein